MISGGRRTRLLALFALLLFIVPVAIVSADQRDDQIRYLRDNANNVRDDITKLSQDVDAMNRDLAEGQKKRAAADKTAQSATTQAAELKKNIDALTAEQKTVNAALTAMTAKLTKEFEASPEVAATQKAVDEAKRAADDAKERALAPLRQTPEYKSAQADHTSATAKVELLKRATPPDPEQMAATMKSQLEADSRIGKMEAGVLTTDADYKAAKAKLDKALADMAALRAGFQEVLRANPDRAALVKQQADARAREQKLRKDYEAANSQATLARSDLNRLDSAIASVQQDKAKKESLLASKKDRLNSLQYELNRLLANYNNTMPR